MLELSRWLARENGYSWKLENAASNDGPGIDGRNNFVNLSGGGYWRVSLNNIALTDKVFLGAWNALYAEMDGGSATINIPYLDGYTCGLVAATFSNGEGFSNGGAFKAGGIDAVVTADAALRATTVRMACSAVPEIGRVFDFNHIDEGRHMYRVSRVEEVSTGVYDVSFRPPLRDPVTIGDVPNFNTPKCKMKLVEGGAPDVTLRRFGTVSATFEEYI